VLRINKTRRLSQAKAKGVVELSPLSSGRASKPHPVVYWGGGYTWVYAVYQPPGFHGQRILTSVIINKQGTFRPFATPLCVYPLPFLAIHHWPHPHIKLVHRTIGLSAAIGIQNTTSLRLVTDTPMRQLTTTLKTGRSYVMFNSHRRCRFAISLSTFPLQCSSYRVLLT